MHDTFSIREMNTIRDRYAYLIRAGGEQLAAGRAATAHDYFEAAGLIRLLAPVEMYPEDIGRAKKFADDLTTAHEARIVFTVAS